VQIRVAKNELSALFCECCYNLACFCSLCNSDKVNNMRIDTIELRKYSRTKKLNKTRATKGGPTHKQLTHGPSRVRRLRSEAFEGDYTKASHNE